MIENFKGKTLVISGATRGIGKAILYRFAQNGVNIAFTYNKNEEEAQKIIADVETKYKIKTKAYPLNVLEPETYKDLFAKIDEDFERVDFFISNAIIYGKSVVGGFAPFMRLKPKGLNNIKNAKNRWREHYHSKLYWESCLYAKLCRAWQFKKCSRNNGKIRRNGAWRV